MVYVPLDDSKVSPDVSGLENSLREKIVGQDHAIQQIIQTYQMYLAGMSPPRHPVGSFLFLGPTGTGKTRIVEATSEIMFGSPEAVVKINCAEFQHSHEISKLIGSPPGYLGHRETSPLFTQERLDKYWTDKIKLSFVLFDEIEKSSDALWNLLLGILDKATLTLGDNRRVKFDRVMVFMTGNLGSSEMENILSPGMGFTSGLLRPAILGKGLKEQISKTGTTAARKKFTPEFLNRIDKIVVFNPLGEKELRGILKIELGMVRHRIAQSMAKKNLFDFVFSPLAEDFLLEEGTNLKCGARHLKRTIQKLLVVPLSTFMTTGQVEGGDNLIVDVDVGRKKLFFTKEVVGEVPERVGRKPRNTSLPAMGQEMAAEAAAGGVHD